MSTLYVVGTPIGNLEDITMRAIRVLGEVDLILCEDTRTSRTLLNKYEIKTATMSFHTHSGLAKIDKIIEMLKEGKDLALITDAGTPAISDPGSLLVSKVREVLGDDVEIKAVPGPSALTAALSIVGLPDHQFTFIGFLPHKKGRETLFNKIAEAKKESFVFYESTHRIEKTLESLKEYFEKSETPNRKIYLARELTKMFEECAVGTAEELIDRIKLDSNKLRGEFVVIVGPNFTQ
ncbi:MAG: 16S rRNA (cytidine(1402)-2'-O)-methyltransferase [bacterium]